VVPVVALLETENGILWIGTFGDGIYRIDHEKYEKITDEDGLPSNYISSLTQSGDGMLWVDTSPYTPYYDHSEDGRLVKFDGQQWQKINGGGFYKLSASADGSLWGLANWAENNKLSTYLGNYKNGQWSMEAIADEIITDFEIAPDGTPWVATRNGIYHLNNSEWQRIDAPWTEKTEASVTTMAISKEGIAWFGLSYDPRISTDKCGARVAGFVEMGVYRYDGKEWDHFTISDGLVDNKVCEILLSQDGTVWIGTFDKGISRYDGTTWESYSVSQETN
jgi:ligand-binding sensor domain-containing protein